jgi:hypothetical protein
MVEFKAWFLEGDERHCLHERSRFVRHQGRWVYTDGEQDPAPLRVGRNDPAPVAAARSSRSAAAEVSPPLSGQPRAGLLLPSCFPCPPRR